MRAPFTLSLSKGQLVLLLLGACAAPARVVEDTTGPVNELSEADTQRTIKEHLPALQSCVNAHLHPQPGAHGKIIVQFHVQQSGETSDVAVRGNVPPNLSVCLAEVFTSMRFRQHRSDPEPVIWPMKY
jgi:hypothetical protein